MHLHGVYASVGLRWQPVAAGSSIKIVVWSACDYCGAVVYMQGLILNFVCELRVTIVRR